MNPTQFRPERSSVPPRIAVPLTESENAVLDAIRNLRFGSVEVVVHSDRIVQITRSQKLRIDGR